MTSAYTLHQGSQPLLISLPHDGTAIPPAIAERMQPWALQVADTDWHVGRFYQPLAVALGASLIRPHWSRYVVDLNRPADGAPLYPGRAETGLLPLTAFDGRALYRPTCEPDLSDQQARVEAYWQPYHGALAAEIERLRSQYGSVLLWEGHSIRSICPMFFEGRLSDFNLGTADGASAADGLLRKLTQRLDAVAGDRWVANGRFKGGFITRRYGNPSDGVHAVQMEMTQDSYMDEAPPFPWDAERAAATQQIVGDLLRVALAWVSERGSAE